MNTDLLETLRRHFGTVSSLTDMSGIVAVRNVTAYKRLQVIVEPFGCNLSAVTAMPVGYPRLVRVVETDSE